MEIVRFLTVESLKNTMPINIDVDSKIIRDVIQVEQDVEVMQLLGSELYEKITSLVSSGDISLVENADYKKLLDDHIIKVLTYLSYSSLVSHTSFQFTDKGIQLRGSDNSQAASIEQVNSIRKKYRNSGELFANMMVDFIHCNLEKFPEYCPEEPESMKPTGRGYTCPIQFD